MEESKLKSIIMERNLIHPISSPVYTVEVRPSGIVKWNGLVNVDFMGKHSWRMTQNSRVIMRDLIAQAVLMPKAGFKDRYEDGYLWDFQGFHSEYDDSCAFMNEYPFVNLTINYSNREPLNIFHYHAHKSDHRRIAILNQMEKMIDEIAGSANHITVARSFFTFSWRGEKIPGSFSHHFVVARDIEEAITLIPLGPESEEQNGIREFRREDWDVTVRDESPGTRKSELVHSHIVSEKSSHNQ